MYPKIHTLIEDYKRLLDFIYEGKSWSIEQKSRAQPHCEYRQLVRYLILEKRKPTLIDLANAEAKALGKNVPDHSTIIHSRDNVRDVLSDRYSGLMARLTQFYTGIIEQENRLKSKYNRPFKIEEVKGSVQIHLNFPGQPSEEFLNVLKELFEIETQSSTHG